MTIIYDKTKSEFLQDIFGIKPIEDLLEQIIYKKMKRVTSINEKRARKNSLLEMGRILNISDIPQDSRISIEYNIPCGSKRIDFIISGLDENKDTNAIVIELKQWDNVDITDKDAIVKTRVAKKIREELHPSYQVLSYTDLLNDYSDVVEGTPINLIPCVFLHNYPQTDNKINNECYSEYTDNAPLFLKTDKEKLQAFIKRYIKYGDNKDVIYCIENGEIRPSKCLADSLVGMVSGNKEFTLIDDQKSVYEEAKALAKEAQAGNKQVLIVKGGPGTGKSVIAINLLADLNKAGIVTQYVSKNASVRNVFVEKLTNKFKKTQVKNLFLSSGSFIDSNINDIGCLIVDEAHRLVEKGGIFGNLGENQIKEIIYASHCSIFFIDEDQKITLKDIGSVDEIKKWAKFCCADVTEMELKSQFRCGGSDGYLARLDNTLGIRETANISLNDIHYDFKIFESPNELRNTIIEKNNNNKSRLVAGYCWNWINTGKDNPDIHDIIIPDEPYNFKMSRNLANDPTFSISKDSINEVGCIHTVQGLEFDYVGVIIGNDILYRNGHLITEPKNRAKTDKSLFGYKKFINENGTKGQESVDMIIRNTYRVLMSRGMKGCYIYCTDSETREYFKKMVN